MAETGMDMFKTASRSHWIRLRTLIVLRWIAICGQVVAITVAQSAFSLSLPLGFCFLAVTAAVAANLIAIFAFPENKRLNEAEVVSMLLFDIAQLCFLLYLTGGLNNPFALLVLAPVTISASVLRLKSTILLGGAAFVLLTAVALFHVPLRTREGFIMQMPHDFLFGFWIAIVIGLGFIAGYARRISIEIHSMSDALLATQMALVREQKLTDLGGVVAAAAHELGTPLATIKLVSSELASELEDPDQREDACLIRDQADRCRDILRSMGRVGKDDKHMQHAPLDTVIREAAEPHTLRGKDIHYLVAPDADGETEQPLIKRQPEVIHGLRNLVQNAVDFAGGNVWIDASWNAASILITISDDGPGYPPQVIGRLGDPFLRRRRSDEEKAKRPEYEGMGLGLFIAKTLLERSGASVRFSNGSDPFLTSEEEPVRSGAVVQVTWPRERISTARDGKIGALGLNQPILP
ncbi:two-component sensor histidine kinase [Meridianimarinicoccus roseus]|uniref:histidine kinase n=1 Tax=Meridianimarinicoccus roseus TaxID=2072018 RepID=A0A2V2LFX8_9RHOB|nr:ActS/PrrB/RegB family redox-sensitive histidine kinase [Meridianimarinicoccus roseus]PWR02146.1 two-component sensor histidine kinase [Meridianimarinicoccus roseus]